MTEIEIDTNGALDLLFEFHTGTIERFQAKNEDAMYSLQIRDQELFMSFVSIGRGKITTITLIQNIAGPTIKELCLLALFLQETEECEVRRFSKLSVLSES